jgi:DDE superfamily endonuclease
MAKECRFSETSAPEEWQEWVAWLKPALHSRTQWRLPLVLLGLLFARGRRTVTSWLRAQGITHEYDDYYYFLASFGRKIEPLATALFLQLLRQLPIGERVLLALDDSPTARYGPRVEGAGLHHNPTSGPDDHKFLYGHVWVTLALVLRHPLWGTIGLPLRALMYVKRKDLPKLARRCHWIFRTKLQLAGALVTWAAKLLQTAGKACWVVADGAYAYRPVFKIILPLGVTYVSRLRKDAGLNTLPEPRRPGQIGGTRRYGKEKISVAKRAAHPRGWQTVDVTMYGQRVTKMYKTFLATWRPIGGVIRVVVVREKDGWQSFFCSNPDATVAEILECFADRSAIENVFHDVKEVWGAGQQQVRNLFTNVACFHLNLWMQTLVEAWAWHKPADEIRDRSACPWDTPDRRPSHADRRKALARQCLQHELSMPHIIHYIGQPIYKLLQTLASLAA